MASVAGSWQKSPDLSGTTWPVSHPAIGAGQILLIFVGGYTYGVDSVPSLPGSTPRFSGSYPDYTLRGALFEISGARPAGSVTVSWTASGCVGAGYACVINDGEFDVVSIAQLDAAANTDTRTLADLTTAWNDAVRLELLVMAMHRELVASGMTVEADSTYHPGPLGGVGSGVGHKPVSSGSTVGSPWVWTSSDVPGGTGAAVGSPSVGWAVIYRPSSAPANPVISGAINSPDGDTAEPPTSPVTAPTVVAISGSTVAVTPNDVDPTATTVTIAYRPVVNGEMGEEVIAGTYSTTSAFPVQISGLAPGGSYAWRVWVTRDGISSENSSNFSSPVTMPVSSVRVFTDPSAAGVSGVEIQVWRLPTGTDLAGQKLFSAAGQQFATALMDGKATLTVRLPELFGLSNGDHVAAICCKRIPGQETWTRIMYDAVVVDG